MRGFRRIVAKAAVLDDFLDDCDEACGRPFLSTGSEIAAALRKAIDEKMNTGETT